MDDEIETLSPGRLSLIVQEYVAEHIVKVVLEEDLSNNAKTTWKEKSYKLQQGVELPQEIWMRVMHSLKKSSDDRIWLMLALSKDNGFHGIQKLILRHATELTDEVLESLMKCCPKELDIHNCPSLTTKTLSTINKYGKNLESLIIGSSNQILPIDIAQNGSLRDEEPEAIYERKWLNTWSSLPRKISGLRNVLKGIWWLGGAETKAQGIKDLEDDDENDKNLKSLDLKYNQINAPNLRKLIIWGHNVKHKQEIILPTQINKTEDTLPTDSVLVDYWNKLMEMFIGNLVHLDLSYCQGFVDFNFMLLSRQTLRHLSLQDVCISTDGWEIIKLMKNLTFLDASQSIELALVHNEPDLLLSGIVESLVNLRGLDISGTNLAGESADRIIGLNTRMHKHLDFLGLLATHHNAAKRFNIPATNITGNADSSQILKSLRYYMERPNMFKKVLRMLYRSLINDYDDEDDDYDDDEDEDYPYSYSCLEILLESFEIHVEDKHLLIIGLCVLFHLLKNLCEQRDSDFREVLLSVRVKKRIINAVVDSMDKHAHDLSLLRNALLILCCFDIEKDFVGQIRHKVVFKILQAIDLAVVNTDSFLLRSAFFILKPMIAASSHAEKLRFSSSGAVQRLCDIVRTLMEKNTMENMSAVWQILISLTDDIPDNSIEFVKCGGLELFRKLRVRLSFGSSLDKALVVLANVAQVKSNRKAFLDLNLVRVVFDLMHNTTSGSRQIPIENYARLSYCATSCMVQLLEEPWDIKSPTKVEVLTSMDVLFLSWNIEMDLLLDFLSVKPFVELLRNPLIECRTFGAWTLAYLTSLFPAEYIPMLGDPKVFISTCDEILTKNTSEDYIFTLINLILTNVNQFFENIHKKNILVSET